MKYLSFIKFKFLASLQFRSEILLWLFLDFLPFFILFFVFVNIYQNQESINGLSLTQTIEYYFLASIIQGLTSVHFESWRSEQIRLGKIDFYLTRPFSYMKELLLSDLAAKLFYIALFIPIYVIFFIIVTVYFNVSVFSTVTQTTLPLFGLLLLSAYLIQLFLGIIITLLTFWFEGAEGLQHFKWVVLVVLSGAMIPVEFMPGWLQGIVTAFPLQYLYAIPISVFQGRSQISINDIMIIGITISGLFFICKLLMRYGVLKYSSTGG